jgi:hypothetical protein
MAVITERWTSDFLGRPTCLCGARMDLGRIEPHPTIRHAEIRAYECKECGDTLIQTFGGESNADAADLPPTPSHPSS